VSCDTNHRIDVRACDNSRRDVGKGLKLNCAKRGGCEAGAKRVNCNSLGISIVEQLSSTVPEACNNRPTSFPIAREASSIADQGKGWIRSLLVLLIEMEGVLLKSKQLRTTALQCLTFVLNPVPEACNNRPARCPIAREASSIADQGKGWIRSLLVLLIEMEGVLLKSKQLRTTALQCLTVIHLARARSLGGNAIAPPGQLRGEPLQPNRLVRCIADLER